MKLYLVQHGDALAKHVDPDRPVSSRGVRDIERMAGLLQEGGVEVAIVEHSGKTRAMQTADILAPHVGDPKLRPRANLAPDDDVTPVAEEMAASREDRMLVGHMPFMGKLATLLLHGQEAPALISFEPGAVLCLERKEIWTVAWMVTPSLLDRSLGR
jgi:phosphohistidine phosphatase